MKLYKHAYLPIILVFTAVVGLSLASCASAPVASGNPITLELLSRKQVVDKFGVDQKRDPFIAPTGILKGTPYEFVVLRLTTSLESKTFIQLTIDARDKDGNATFTLWDKKDFKEMWQSWEAGEAKTANRESLIEDYYLPGTSFSSQKGKNQYYIVLIGKNPLNHPLSVTIDVNAAGLSPFAQSFSIE